MNLPIPLACLPPRQEAVVVEIAGGCGLVRRLEALGIRPGVRLSVISAFSFGGPVTVCVGRTEVALGRGMAKRILVEPQGKPQT